MATNGGLIQLGAEADKALTNIWKSTGDHVVYNLDLEGWNANNFPTRTPPAGKVYQSSCYVWPPNLKPGNLVLKWDGLATWNANGQNFGSLTSTAGNRKVLTPPSYLNYPAGADDEFGRSGNTSILFRITGVGDTPPSNIRLCHEDDEADMDAGQVFNSEWLESVDRLNPGIIRWLNSPSGSGAYLSDYDHMTVESDNKWLDKFVPANFVDSCTLDGGTQTFIAAKSGFSLTHGASVHIRIPTRPTSKVFYLNVEGTGAKPVRPRTGHDPNFASCPSDQTIPRAGGVSTFIYHEDFDAWLINGNTSGSAGTGTVGGYSGGLPLSVKIALCNTLGCDFWWNPPFIVCAPFHTQYFTDVFTYIRDNLNPGLKVWVEGPNETWNTRYWGFTSSYYFAWTEGERMGGTLLTNARNNGYTIVGLEQGYGRFMSQMGAFLESFYGPQNKGVKYELLCGFQTAGNAYQQSGKTLCSNYVNEDPVNNKPATNYITGFAFTNYHNSSTYANVGSAGTANATWQGWPYFLYYMEQYWNNFADPDGGYTSQELQNRRNAQLKAVRYITNGLMETRSYAPGSWYGLNYNEFMRTRISYMWDRYGKPTYYYEGGNSPDWFDVDFTVNIQGPDPEGVTRPSAIGRQPAGSGEKYAEYLRATKYDPKLRWVEFYKLKQLTNIPHSSYPARYFQSGDGGAWSSYDPEPSTIRYLTGQTYTASSLVWRYPNLKGPCESTKGFEDFSNGRFVMYAKTA